jgi:hypothetical protein
VVAVSVVVALALDDSVWTLDWDAIIDNDATEDADTAGDADEEALPEEDVDCVTRRAVDVIVWDPVGDFDIKGV